VETGARILSALAKLVGTASLSELSAAVRLPPSKTHRYLRALIGTGFVDHDGPTARYRLGAEALGLGLAALAGIDVIAMAEGPIAALCAEVAETVLLSIWANGGATVVRVELPPRQVTVITRIGSVLPLRRSASGLALAAFLPEAHAAARTDGAARRADATFERRLREARAHGMAAVHGLFFPGIDAIAAPIFDAAGRAAAVIAVLGSSAGFDASVGGVPARRLKAAAAALSARLGYRARAARTRSRSSGVSTPAAGALLSATK
jgi:DNA-binding IclR family transcriptional regulator